MKKVVLVLISFLFIFSSIILPEQGQADNSAEIKAIDAQLKELKAKEAQAKANRQVALDQISNLKTQIANTEEEIQELELQIATKNKEVEVLEATIAQTKEELEAAKLELDNAIQRVIDRNELLKSRLHIMYTNGSVSYLDVLLSSTSFTDFLDRFQALNSILNKDKELLEARKHDQAVIEKAKEEVETRIVALNDNLDELEQLRTELYTQEKEKEVAITSFKGQIEVHEEISKEAEDAMANMISQRSKLLAKKAELTYDGKFGYPLPTDRKYRITSYYGTRKDPFTGRTSSHTGVDIAAPGGTNILASAGGVVIVAEYMSSYGYAVVIEHGDGIKTLYAHMRQINVSVGQNVNRGAKIGEVGTTGRSTGNHLHFEVRKWDSRVDPNKYVKFY
ncbi:murein hydrolase activator EnvC family protein [Chengkuizengella sp. SCS-71B]|uniref:murein hydrolase activator EnvC family protein n=1 Tax=Chengkuizengella sp. SCS-71B TaxID=3115290 RepID=UPI0032C220A7